MLLFTRRTAFWTGLQHLGVEKNDVMLGPDTIYDVMLHPLKTLKVKPVYYKLANNLIPDWDHIKGLATLESAKALLLVHYFGQPQGIFLARDICARH